MLFLISDLIKALNDTSKILIYGAGVYANIVYPYLKRAGLKDKIIAFVVTDRKNNIEAIDEIPVKCLTDFEFNQKEIYSILVAVSKRYIFEIEEELKNKNIKRIVRLIDYEISDLNKISDKKFFKCIIDIGVWNHANSLQETKKEIGKFFKMKEKSKQNKKQIVFIVGNMSVRIVKIINALIINGYNIKLLRYGIVESNLASSELLTINLECIKCLKIEELFYQAIQYNPIVYFFEPTWGDCSWAETMIRHKEIFGKVIISLYDVLNDGYAFATNDAKYTEKYALENASGIVWRYYSKEYLEKEKGFNYKGKSIHFLDYCKGYELEKKEKEENSLLKLCCVTGDLHPFFCASHETKKYIREAQFVDILKKIGNCQDCIFHVFTGRSSNENKQLCIQLEKKYKNFKVFYSTSHDELIEKISAYDYGCFLFDGEIEIPSSVSVDKKYYGSQYINAISNRYFDYIDAGIPLIGTRPLKLCDFFDKLGIIVKMGLSNFDIKYLLNYRKEYRDRLKIARKELLMDNQIHKLIDFFENI